MYCFLIIVGAPLLLPSSCSVSYTKEWNLPKWQAKYALEYMLSLKDEDQKEKIAEILLLQLENPALLLYLLSHPKSRPFLNQRVQNFLEQYENNKHKDSEESSRLAAKTAFHYRTVLNESLHPMLVKYNSLAEQREQEELPRKQSKMFFQLEQFSDQDLIDLTRSRMEYPKILCDLSEDR